jgi:hypothetical protein
MEILRKFLIFYFNFSGILSLKIHKNKLKVSKFWFLINFLNLPIWFVLFYFVTFTNFNDAAKNIEAPSRFTIFSVILSISFHTFSLLVMSCCVYVQLFKQNQIIDLIKNCLKIFRRFNFSQNSKPFKNFERKCLKILVSWSISVTIFELLYYFSIYNLNWKGLIFFTLSTWNILISLQFIIFVSFFLNFFEFLLKTLNCELEERFQQISAVKKGFDDIFNKFCCLYDLIQEIKKTFGFLLNLSVFYAVCIVTIRVSLNFVINFFNMK